MSRGTPRLATGQLKVYGNGGEHRDRDRRCRSELGIGLAELYALAAVVAHYRVSGRPALRVEVGKLIERTEGLRAVDRRALAELERRGLVESVGASKKTRPCVPTRRGFELLGDCPPMALAASI